MLFDVDQSTCIFDIWEFILFSFVYEMSYKLWIMLEHIILGMKDGNRMQWF